jgi:hypothetical protein
LVKKRTGLAINLPYNKKRSKKTTQIHKKTEVKTHKQKMKCAIIIALSSLLFSCSNNDEKEPDADYQVLGIETVSINGERIAVEDDCLLNIQNIGWMTIDGIENRQTQKQIILSYAIVIEPDTPLTIQVDCNPNTCVVIDDEEINGRHTYKAVVSREGYQEGITYLFKIIPISRQ